MKRVFVLLIECVLGITMLAAQEPVRVTSILEVLDVISGERRVLREFPYLIEAPNWTVDGQWLIFNSGGLLYRVPADGSNGEPELIPTGIATSCNNDHVLSSDGRSIAISSGTASDGRSRIWTLPITGGDPVLITPNAPSYLHGWSPDVSTLAYCGERDDNYDIYTISASGGEEQRLTTNTGLDDGPEYTPDGRHIWFNSVRGGEMQLWRMLSDGSDQVQMTFAAGRSAWFPHVSPDGEWVVYLSYDATEVEISAHPANKQVELRIMSSRGGESRLLLSLFGGQGTINVNSWSPDSRHISFVSYRP